MKMKMGACIALLVLILGEIKLDSVAYADPPIEHCGRGDITALAQAGQQGIIQLESGHPTPGLTQAYFRCQARLYDDNGPNVPHVWCEDDLFLLGIWVFDNYKFYGEDRNTAAAFIEKFVSEVTWHSLESTVEVNLNRTATKDAVHPIFGHLVLFQDYAVFGQEPIQPDTYIWEWVSKHPDLIGPENPEGVYETAIGEVEIVSHQEHISRVAAGTW